MNTQIKLILLNRWVAFFHDILWIPASFILAVWIRFNLGYIPADQIPFLYKGIAIAIPVQGAIFWLFGLYRGMWRFASVQDLVRIIKSVLLGLPIITTIMAMMTRLEGIPRSFFLLYPLLLAAGLCLPRIMYRLFKDHRFHIPSNAGKRTLIIGAGSAGEMLSRDLLHRDEYQPLAFLDDDPVKWNKEIHGIRVFGDGNRLEEMVDVLSIELVVIAIPSAGKAVINRYVNKCNNLPVQYKILPSLFEMQGKVIDADKLRAVTVEDLLGREVISLDTDAITGYLRNRVVLVTGGGGSIGSELCRQIAAQEPARLIVFDHSEYNLYAIDHELTETFSELPLIGVLGDIRNKERVEWVFRKFSPEVIFHAAAYKHVPMVERNPAEGVRNNIFGTITIAQLADRYGVDRFVLVSTDKAVNPANVMGATKRVAELFCQNFSKRSATKFITTRFGNVLGSAGSVVPLFQKQIEAGGPVTVTHPEITRYFMTIPESVSLILQAGAMGGGGEIFVLDMGEPILIRKLAEQMIRLSGFIPDEDIKIVYTGLRPGEKLFEEILHESEGLQPTNHAKLLLARSRAVDWDWLLGELDVLREAAVSRAVGHLKEHLKAIVPEYTYERMPAGIDVKTEAVIADEG
ncbi:MAG TPA: polysaccharide biosynthesis protein [Desulfobulbaceae bacterium]|nr:polysaccharide biosynthesis protein [Desulfobulbaceae bacterium]